MNKNLIVQCKSGKKSDEEQERVGVKLLCKRWNEKRIWR